MFDHICKNCQYSFFTEEAYDADKDAIVCPECGHHVKEN